MIKQRFLNLTLTIWFLSPKIHCVWDEFSYDQKFILLSTSQKLLLLKLPHNIVPDMSAGEWESSCSIQVDEKGLDLNLKAEFYFYSCLINAALRAPSVQMCKDIKVFMVAPKNEGLVINYLVYS